MVGLHTASVLILIYSEVTRPGEERGLLDITELDTGQRKPRPLRTAAELVLQPHTRPSQAWPTGQKQPKPKGSVQGFGDFSKV